MRVGLTNFAMRILERCTCTSVVIRMYWYLPNGPLERTPGPRTMLRCRLVPRTPITGEQMLEVLV